MGQKKGDLIKVVVVPRNKHCISGILVRVRPPRVDGDLSSPAMSHIPTRTPGGARTLAVTTLEPED